MNQLKFKLLWVSLLIICMSNCKKDKVDPNSEIESCLDGKVIKGVKNQKGTVHYNSDENQYAVYVTIPGTYDSRDAGFICDKLDMLEVEGLSINFDGNYLSYKEDRKPNIGGLEYYYLDITDFKINKE